MRKILLYLVCLTSFFSVYAQQKQLRIEDYANPAFRPKMLQQLQWIPGTDRYSFVENNSIFAGSMQTSGVVLLTLGDFNKCLSAISIQADTKAFPPIKWKNDSIFTFIQGSAFIELNIKSKKASVLNKWPENAEHFDISVKNHVAFVVNGTLSVSQIGAKKTIVLAEGDGHNIVCGKSVHRDEFGINKGTYWSPEGDKLAFYRMDQSMVTDYPMADYRPTTAAKSKLIKYPMAGAMSHQVKLGIYDTKKHKVRYLETGEPADQYLTNLTWSPDGSLMYIQVLNRDQNHMKLNVYDVKTGKFIKTLFEETHDKYVEPLNELLFLTDRKDHFIYQSQRDGFNHLYLCKTDGSIVRQITTGEWVVTDLIGLSQDSKSAYITATKDSPLERHCYAVDLQSGEMRKLSSEAGTHAVQISADDKMIIDSWSSYTTFYKVVVRSLESNREQVLSDQADPLLGYNKPEISVFSIKAADGKTDLHARLIKPANFDPAKKYPVMFYLYGGPHAQMVQNRWLGGADMFMVYMASKGYVVFTVDNRGSANRGREFEQSTFRQLGTVESEDQMMGVNYLKAQPYVDQSRMGIFGWSFGGFMTSTMMTRQPDVFKAGVAGGPVIDWKYYEIMYTERYMDTPESNPEGYKKASLLNRVTDLKGKLLIIEGLEDGTVVPQHSYSFINECIAKGVLVDFFPYPNHEHNVRGKDRIHLYMKIEDYFNRNL